MKKRWLQKIVAMVLVLTMCFGIAPGNGYGGMIAKAEETVIPLVNGNFENNLWGDENKGWEVEADGEYTAKNDNNNELNFYRDTAGTITLTQTVSNLSAGTYQLSARIKGEKASISFVFGESKDAEGKEPISDSDYSDVLSDAFTLVDTKDVKVGFILDIQDGGWGYIDYVSLKLIVNTGDTGDTENSGLTITSSTTSPVVGTSFTLTADVTYNGEKVTDLTAAGLKLWWWCDNEKQNDWFVNYDKTNGNNLYLKISATEPGTCGLNVELKKGEETIGEIVKYEISIGIDESAARGGVNVTKVENLADDFIMGMDISSVISEFDSGVTFKDYDGNTISNVTDFCTFLASQGITHIRVRVWNNPYTADGKGYGGGNNDVAKAKLIADGCRAAGIKMLVDFHCSDLWTDPGKQQAPKAWKGYSVEQKADALTAYMTDALNTIDPDKDTVAMVQVGNETTSGFVGETDDANMCTLFSAGSEGVRAYNSEVKVVIHVTNPEKGNVTRWAKKLSDNNVDYDILATSYYPYWHGTLDNIKSEFEKVKNTYHKDVMVAETSYAYTLVDSDGHDNTVRVGNNDNAADTTEPFTVQGQATAIRNLINAVSEAGGLGVFYWEPAWLTVGDIRGLEGATLDAQIAANEQKWETYGSGWASSYAAEYDAEDAGKWYGGTAVDNEAMFYPDGTPTESLPVWKYVRTGSVSTLTSLETIGTTEELNSSFILGGDVTYKLPDTITNGYSKEGKLVTVRDTVTWNQREKEALLQAMSAQKRGIYFVNGTVTLSEEVTSGAYAGKKSVDIVYTLTLLPKNLITNTTDSGFEEGCKKNFTVGGSGTLTIPSTNDPYAGTGSMHWYSAAAATGTVTYKNAMTLPEGTYNFELKAQGYAGDQVRLNILDGADENAQVLFSGDAAALDGWKNWQTPTVSFTLTEETTVYLQIVVDIQAGGWGTADALYLYSTADTSGNGDSDPGSGSTSTGGENGSNTPSTPDTAVTVNPDGTSSEVVTTTGVNEAGKEIEKTTTTNKDADGNVTGVTEVTVIPAVAENASAAVTVTKDASGAVTNAQADVTKAGTIKSGTVTATLSGAVVAQLKEASGTEDLTVTMTVVNEKGKTKYTVTAEVQDLAIGGKLAVVAVDAKTGEYVLVNDKNYTVSKNGSVKLTLKSGADYVLLTESEAKAVEKAVLKTVKVKKSSVTVKKGKTTAMQLSSALNMDNVKKVTYSASKKSVAKVNKNGKITAKKAGIVTIKAKVTLNNGKTKTVSMKVKVK